MNEDFFAEWFHFCEKTDIDYRFVGRAQVVLHKEQPFEVSIILEES